MRNRRTKEVRCRFASSRAAGDVTALLLWIGMREKLRRVGCEVVDSARKLEAQSRQHPKFTTKALMRSNQIIGQHYGHGARLTARLTALSRGRALQAYQIREHELSLTAAFY